MPLLTAFALVALLGYASAKDIDPSPEDTIELAGDPALPTMAGADQPASLPAEPAVAEPVETPAPPPITPSRSERLRREAQRALAAGDSATCRAKLEEAVSVSANWEIPRVELAAFLAGGGEELVYALGLLEEAERIHPENPRIYRTRGQVFELLGQDESAVEAYAKSLALREDADLRAQRALVLVRLGREVEAIEQLEQIRTIKPSDTAAREHLADLYEKAGRIDDAERELLQIANLSPNKPAPLVKLSRFYLRNGNPEKASYLELRARGLEGTFRLLRPLLPSSK